MKKFLSLLAIALSIFTFAEPFVKSANASAQTEYLRVIDKTTPFYKNVYDTIPLFYLPYSYYVKVINLSGEYYHVELHCDNGQVAIDGYVPSERLYNDDLAVSSPYLELTITTVSTAVLYSDQNLSIPLQYIFPERSLYYYGEITTEQGTLFYVGYNSRLGYVKESDVFPFIINNHPNKMPSSSESLPENEKVSSTQNADVFGLRAIIIACLIFAGITALFIAVKNGKNRQNHLNYYEENDYE